MPPLGRQRGHLLSHHADLHAKDTSLLFGRGPLQARIPAGELHGEFHFDLVEGETGPSPPGYECLSLPNAGPLPRTAEEGCCYPPGLPETPTGWEWEGCGHRGGERDCVEGTGGKTAPRGQQPGARPLCRHFPPLPAHPVHLNHICVPVLGFYSLWVQLQRREGRECEREGRRWRGGERELSAGRQLLPAGSTVRQNRAEAALRGSSPRPLLSWLVKEPDARVGTPARPLCDGYSHPFTGAHMEAHKQEATCSTTRTGVNGGGGQCGLRCRMGARRGQGLLSGVRLPGSESQHWRRQACDLGTFSPWLSLLCVFRAPQPIADAAGCTVAKAPRDNWGGAAGLQGGKHAVGEAPGRGRSPRKWGEQQRLRGIPPRGPARPPLL